MKAWVSIAAAVAVMLGGSASHAAEPSPRTGRWVEANHVLLRAELTGKGSDVVVLIHDMGLNLEVWDELVPKIQSGRQLLRYDMRGFGLSEKFRTPVTIEDHVEDLHSLLDALGLKKPVTVVGESIGGAIALKFAAKYPDRVKGVVSINGLVRIKRTAPPANPNLATGRDTAKLIETEGVRAYLKTDLDWLYPPELRTPERVERLMGMEVAQDPTDRALAMRMQPMAADIETELPKIKAPALLIAGMINSSYTTGEWRTITAAIPHGQLVTIASAHHAAFETPDLVFTPLRAFLDAQAGR